MFRCFSILIFCAVLSAAEDVKWIDVSNDTAVSVDGLGWFEENDGEFIRLPIARKDDITKLAWRMSLCPAAARVRFKTDSPTLSVCIDHGMTEEGRLEMWHMSSVAVSGIDLYVGEPDNMSFLFTSNPKQAKGDYVHKYFSGMEKKLREFTLYLPSYAELKSLKIGISNDAALLAPIPYKRKAPVVIYGTSITQGACASRGSNGYAAQLQRRLNTDVINLGFSGSGCGEPVMAELMTEIDASLYIVDSVANMEAQVMQERYENFVRILRKNKPDTPVILMTKIHFAYEALPANIYESRSYYDKQHKALFRTYDKLKQEGDDNIYLFDSGALIQAGGDHPTADGIHLTDVGFEIIADALVPFAEEILE
ncbi:hypothetical protein L21SP3_02097 [Sedimentisphaera cyanobacteriorum]|uniref:SGNH hydrolase-type esterase domain-containing protein n=1 Tax=Sedimentisphaera cyanobacteriorum TaxID=1940790 RepID=A0A1Q2HS32_9BACT|nr:SGNH/GDSL hydrolase family protein [Sedimentisphaera cyanobacteriorum]AQQ10269.1 hypothetical protein L21SP3_02097 [Sedimentisphaera cyanobacteriorum]